MDSESFTHCHMAVYDLFHAPKMDTARLDHVGVLDRIDLYGSTNLLKDPMNKCSWAGPMGLIMLIDRASTAYTRHMHICS